MSIQDNMSVGADEAPKFKLSEIIAAMNDDRIELDCKAVIAVCSSTQSISMINVPMLDITKRSETVLLLIHNGLSRLLTEASSFRPEALAAFAAAMGREVSCDRMANSVSGLLKELAGKEDCHE